MSKIDLYSNEPALQLMLDLTRIALKAHANNPSPVDIKCELAALPADSLMQIEEDLTTALLPFKTIDTTTTHDDYWDCNCKQNYIHAKTETICTKCNATQEGQPDSRAIEVEAFLKGK